MIKRVLLAVIVLASSAAAAYTLNLLDQIVHGTLYYYGLHFSYDWANPYWTLLRIIQVLLAITIITTIASTAFTLRSYLVKKKPRAKVVSSPKVVRKVGVATHNIKKTPAFSAAPPPLLSPAGSSPPQQATQRLGMEPAPTPRSSIAPAPVARPSPSHTASDVSGLIKCFNCGKSFTQPLRMLDFQGDRPRIVSICPFCNEIMPAAPRIEGREQGQDKKLPVEQDDNSMPQPITE